MLVAGRMEHHQEGAYYARSNRQWVKLGRRTPQEAIDGCLKLVVAPQEPLQEQPKLWQVVARWLESYRFRLAR